MFFSSESSFNNTHEYVLCVPIILCMRSNDYIAVGNYAKKYGL